MAAIGVVSGTVETLMLLTVANLADQRYTSDYGNAFAITEIGSALTLLVGMTMDYYSTQRAIEQKKRGDFFELKRNSLEILKPSTI